LRWLLLNNPLHDRLLNFSLLNAWWIKYGQINQGISMAAKSDKRQAKKEPKGRLL
jgi:hypothetical protein